VVVDLLDDEPLADRLPRQRTPSGALHVHRRLRELRLARVEGSQVLVDRVSELALRLPAALGAHVRQKIECMT
jgi:hypothetical protein